MWDTVQTNQLHLLHDLVARSGDSFQDSLCTQGFPR